jgi:hypothetical protein
LERALAEGKEQLPMRILAYCLLHNHWHLLLWLFFLLFILFSQAFFRQKSSGGKGKRLICC